MPLFPDLFLSDSHFGNSILKTTPKVGKVTGINLVDETSEFVVISHFGKIIRIDTKSVRAAGRSTQGVKLLDLEPHKRPARSSREPASKILGSHTGRCRQVFQAAGWHARAGGGSGRRRKIREPHRRPAARDVFPPPAIAGQLDMAGGAVEPRSAGTCRGHEKCSPGHRP